MWHTWTVRLGVVAVACARVFHTFTHVIKLGCIPFYKLVNRQAGTSDDISIAGGVSKETIMLFSIIDEVHM